MKMLNDALVESVRTERAIDSVPSPDQFARAFDNYLAMQKVIDERMPDAIMDIKGKKFRKKSYWRSVAKGFMLDVGLTKESFFDHDGDWGYRVLYTAVSPNGQSATGDGTCMASEKRRKDGSMTDATHHNVRGHAHTRAFNRAVSNLVGFGEVSAEEIIQEHQGNKAKPSPPPPQNAPQAAQNASGGSREWDGNLRVKSGKNKGKKWAELDKGFLDWALEQTGNIRDMAAKEIGRRAAMETGFEGATDAEVVDEVNPPPPDEEF